jgi:hypothetical protein
MTIGARLDAGKADPAAFGDRSADCFKSGAPTLRDGCACVVGAIPIS